MPYKAHVPRIVHDRFARWLFWLALVVGVLPAVAMPEVSDDFKTFVFRIRPGIYFADDPAFKGRRRELVAQDYVYTFQRMYDPAVQSPGQSILEDEGIIGLRELREAALKDKK